MPKISDQPLELLYVRLFKSDLDELRKLYRGNLGVNKAVRTIVHIFVSRSKAAADKVIDNIDDGDLASILDNMEINDDDSDSETSLGL